jgi:hypothetical protein
MRILWSKLIGTVLLLSLFGGLFITPQAALADCVGERTQCFASAREAYERCSRGCNGVACEFWCETLYDIDRAACVFEFITCTGIRL